MIVKVATQPVIRESDGETLLLVETWCGGGDLDQPDTVRVVQAPDEED